MTASERAGRGRRRVVGALAAALAAGLAATMAALTAGCSMGLQDLPVGREADGPSYHVTAVFDHADRVVRGAPVREGQLTIGRVHDLSTDGRRAMVGLSLRSDVQLPADVTAAIELPSALGGPFIRIESDGPAAHGGAAQADDGRVLSDGDTIPLARTRVGPELESSLASLGLLLNGSGVDQLKTVMTELNKAYGGRGDQVRGLVEDANDLLATADEHEGEFNRTLAALDSMTGTLTAHQEELNRGLEAAAPMMSLLADQSDRISGLLDSSAALAQKADTLLTASGDRLGAEVDQIALILEAMRGFNANDTATLQSATTFIHAFSSVIEGDYITFDGALDVPESLYELWVGGRPPGHRDADAAAGTGGPR